eukprot:Blabericola_migrator_1__4951@NODE_257_length_10777_cov_171_650047_g215_i0_p7_GENE_NODE_257_length_10777_cov_171_650047_g215_i0NODE_257_length_10777_cov_171_650047_g215_i0_p7_ORF_typecomplete_len188_score37_79IMS_C/PF11799_8/3_4e12_NODE_257_length_10777_cov_171_650047_g215_i0372935
MLASISERVEKDLERLNLVGSKIVFKVKDEHFRSSSSSGGLPFATDKADAIYKEGRALFKKFWKAKQPELKIRLLGLTMTALAPKKAESKIATLTSFLQTDGPRKAEGRTVKGDAPKKEGSLELWLRSAETKLEITSQGKAYKRKASVAPSTKPKKKKMTLANTQRQIRTLQECFNLEPDVVIELSE